jgi:hypothetical protein
MVLFFHNLSPHNPPKKKKRNAHTRLQIGPKIKLPHASLSHPGGRPLESTLLLLPFFLFVCFCFCFFILGGVILLALRTGVGSQRRRGATGAAVLKEGSARSPRPGTPGHNSPALPPPPPCPRPRAPTQAQLTWSRGPPAPPGQV